MSPIPAPKSAMRGPRGSLSRALVPGSGRPSNPSQVKVRMRLSTTPTLVSSAGAGGAVATVYAPTLSSVPNVAGFQSTYDEYRVVGIQYHVQAAASNQGSTAFYIDDSDTANPTFNSAASRRPVVLPNNHINPKSTHVFQYRSENFPDLQYYSTVTQATTQFCALKIYSDDTNYNTGNSAKLWTVWSELTVEFRGIGAP